MKYALVITDSRGRDLDYYFRKSVTVKVDLHVFPGAGMETLIDHAMELQPERYDTILLAGGICDVTEKVPKCRSIRLRENATTSLVNST